MQNFTLKNTVRLAMLSAVMLFSELSADSKTVFVPRSITHDATYELSLSNYDIYHHSNQQCCYPSVHLYASYFFQKARRNCDLGDAFLPDSTNSTALAQDGSQRSGTECFANPCDFSFNPERKVQGAYLQAHLDFAYLSNWCRGWWLDIASAVVNVRHDLCFDGCELQDTTTPDFCNRRWNFDHFPRCKRSRTGLDDIQVKVGYNYYYNNCDHFGIYGVFTIPTGRRHCDKYIFEPRVGTRHGAVGVGINTDYTAWSCNGHNFTWMADLKYRYVLKACDQRLFARSHDDFCGFLPTDADRTLADGNFFAGKARVKPRSTVDFWTAGHYQWCNAHFEFGYNLWWRQRECIECVSICDNVKDNSLTDSVTTDRNRTFDNDSAAADRALTNKVYAALGYTWDCCNVATLWGIGASYEFPQCRRSAFDHWAVWLKFGASF